MTPHFQWEENECPRPSGPLRNECPAHPGLCRVTGPSPVGHTLTGRHGKEPVEQASTASLAF